MSDNVIKINKIPSPTWNRLGMNDASIELKSVCHGEGKITANIPDDAEIRTEGSDYMNLVKGAMGDVFDKTLSENIRDTEVFCIPDGRDIKNPIVISSDFDNSCAGSKRYVIEVGKGACVTLLYDYSSESRADGRYCIQTIIKAEKGSKVTLVQTDRPGCEFELFSDIGAQLEDDASLDIVNIFLGGKNIYHGCKVVLKGDRSSVKKDIGYFLKGDMSLDMNYVVIHEGKQTECDIKASGVLEEKSEKLFRGTIDFKNGCGGSKGSETEDVILRDDTVINKTIPVILCAEEDVEGSHGATIGRIDEDLIFYMKTRGFEEEDIYKMISRSRLLSFCGKIPDDEIRQKTMSVLDK